MILKFLIIAAVVGFIYLKFFHKPSPQQMPKSKKRQDKKMPKVDETVECCVCSTFVSVDEAILSNAQYYCSQECLEK